MPDNSILKIAMDNFSDCLASEFAEDFLGKILRASVDVTSSRAKTNT